MAKKLRKHSLVDLLGQEVTRREHNIDVYDEKHIDLDEVIKELAADNYAVIFITEDILYRADDAMKKYSDSPLPAIIPIPSNKGSKGLGMENISLGSAAVDINWLFSYDPDAPVAGTDFTYPGKNTWAFVLRSIEAGAGEFSFIIAPSFQSGGTTEWDHDGDGVDGGGEAEHVEDFGRVVVALP